MERALSTDSRANIQVLSFPNNQTSPICCASFSTTRTDFPRLSPPTRCAFSRQCASFTGNKEMLQVLSIYTNY